MVKSWLDKFQSRKRNKLANQELVNRIRRLEYKTDAWLTLDFRPIMDTITAEVGDDSWISQFEGLRSIQNLDFSMKVGQDLRFAGEGQFSDAENAELFHDAVKGALAAAKLSVSGDREAVDVLNKIKIKAKDNRVVVDFQINKADVEKLIAKGEDLVQL